MRVISKFFVVVSIVTFAACFSAVRAATFTVNQPDDAGDGVCDATCTLRDAVQEANTLDGDDTIDFVSSLTTIALDDEIEIINEHGSLRILGPGADRLTIDGGPGTNRIFFLNAYEPNSATIEIAGVTLTGGDGGGAVSIGSGGAILVTGPSPNLTLRAVHVTGNSATIGGGASFTEGTGFHIVDSTFSNNFSTLDCGAIYNNGDLAVANSTISGNQASRNGGGICSTGNTTLRNVTITNNSGTGGGIWHDTGTLNLGNTVLAGNQGLYPEIDLVSGTVTSAGYNLVGASPGDATNTGLPITYQPTDTLDTPPTLLPLGNYGGPTPCQPPQFGSPVIDGGYDVLAVDPFDGMPLDFDQRGQNFDRWAMGDVDIGAVEAQDARLYVTQTADDNGPCDDQCALREAVAAAPAGGVVDFSPTLLPGTVLNVTNGEILVDKNLKILGPGADRITIDAGHNSRIFYLNGLYVTVSGLTLMGGDRADKGGAIYSNGYLTIDGVNFVNNGAVFGGAVYLDQFGFDQVIKNSTFSGNAAGSSGGGVECFGTGGTHRLSVLNSTFTANSQGVSGGAFTNRGCVGAMRNVTITGNTGIQNGGIYLTGGGTMNIGNSIVAGNTATGVPPQLYAPEILNAGTFTSAGNNLIGDGPGDSTSTYNLILYQPTDILDTPPLLGPLQNNGGPTPTLALMAGSPAIDSGDNALARDPFVGAPTPLFTDQRGFFRIIGSPVPTVDIGAFEFGSANNWSAPTGVGTSVSVPLGPVTVEFADVGQSGTTTAAAIDPFSAGSPPANFTFGGLLPAFEVSSTAAYTAPITICVQAPNIDDPVVFSQLALFHVENGVPVDRTISRDFPTRTISAQVTSLSPFVVGSYNGPTAASVSVGGRVMSSTGAGVPRAELTISDPATGEVRSAISSSFGYYRFEGVEAGRSYVLRVRAKGLQFLPDTRVVNVTDNIADVDFTAGGTENTRPVTRKTDAKKGGLKK